MIPSLQVEYREMDERLAHISDNDDYSDEEKKDVTPTVRPEKPKLLLSQPPPPPMELTPPPPEEDSENDDPTGKSVSSNPGGGQFILS